MSKDNYTEDENWEKNKYNSEEAVADNAWREWITTNGYIGFVGCSFTWGQGLWVYDKDNKNTPTYSEYIFQNIEPTEESDNVRKELRYPKILGDHFGTDILSKKMNGGCDAQSMDILEDVLNRTSQNPEMSGKWPLEKMRLLIFQHSALIRNSYIFDYKGKRYRVKPQEGVGITDGVWEIYPWETRSKENNDNRGQYEQCSCADDEGRFVDDGIFYDYLIDAGIDVNEFVLHYARQVLRKVQDILKEFDNLGIPIVCWHWEEELLNVIDEEEFTWIKSLTAPIIVNDKEFPYYGMAAESHKNLYIKDDETSNRYGEDTDEHPSKYGHEIIASSIITNLRDREITLYL